MFDIYKKELNWGGKKLVFETGKIARQADGAVMASLGDTTVLCTVVGARSPKPGLDFFPLTVNYVLDFVKQNDLYLEQWNNENGESSFARKGVLANEN